MGGRFKHSGGGVTIAQAATGSGKAKDVDMGASPSASEITDDGADRPKVRMFCSATNCKQKPAQLCDWGKCGKCCSDRCIAHTPCSGFKNPPQCSASETFFDLNDVRSPMKGITENGGGG